MGHHDRQPRSPRRLIDIPGLSAIRRSEHTRMLLLGVLVGLVGGLAAGVFDGVLVGVGRLLLRADDPSLGGMEWQWRLFGPVAAGLVAGLVIRWAARSGRARGIPDAIEAVNLREGRVSVREGVVSAVAAVLALGGGHSAGREGPIVHFASSLSSGLCKALGISPHHARILVAAGAAAGIGASFNAPLGAAFFALEILLGNFALSNFAPVVVATVTGTMVGQLLLGGDRVALQLPDFRLTHPGSLAIYPVLGVLCGLVAVAFKRLLAWSGTLWDRSGVPTWLRPGVAGLVVGMIAVVGLPQVMGNGYGFVKVLLGGHEVAIWLLALILVAKLVATLVSFTSGSGAGLFAPSLVMGAVTGTLFGSAVHALWPDFAGPAGTYGIVGMGAVVAAITQAPITMGLTLFELTRNYQIMLPLLLTLAVSGLVFTAIERRSIYLAQLDERGVKVDRGREEMVMYDLHVADVMRQDGYLIATPDVAFSTLARLFLTHRCHEVFVVDHEDAFVGVVDIQDVKGLLGHPADDIDVARFIRTGVPAIRAEMPLAEVMALYFRSGRDALPVVDDWGRLRGVLLERDVVGAYNQEVLRKDVLLARVASGPDGDRHTDFFELPPGYVMEHVDVTGQLVGHDLRELALPRRFGVTVVAVGVADPQSGEVHRLPTCSDRVLCEGDQLVVIGPVEAVERLQDEQADAELTQEVSRSDLA